MDATSSAEKLYKDVILIIDPLQHLPFKMYPQRPPVAVVEPVVPTPPVMKTHAATGQRSGPITGESAGMECLLYNITIGSMRVGEHGPSKIFVILVYQVRALNFNDLPPSYMQNYNHLFNVCI